MIVITDSSDYDQGYAKLREFFMMLSEAQLLNIKTIEQLLQLQVKIPDFLRNQLSMLKARWPEYISEVFECARQSHFSEAADICHKMKGHAGMLGFHAVQLRAGDLETLFRNQKKPIASDHNQYKEVVLQLDQVFQESLKFLELWLRQNSG